MIPVKQTDLTTTSGNCFAACVATLLELPIEDVPNFVLWEDNWFEEVNKFLISRGLFMIRLELSEPIPVDEIHDSIIPYKFNLVGNMIVGGTTPRGHGHAVILNRGNLSHDPHPSNIFLEQVTTLFITCKVM